MIDLKLLQKDFDGVNAALTRRNVAPELLSDLKTSYETLKKAKAAFEEAQAEQNRMSRLFAQALLGTHT